MEIGSYERGDGGVSLEFESLFSDTREGCRRDSRRHVASTHMEEDNDVVIDMTGDLSQTEGEDDGRFCAVCLKELNELNFLMQMKHVKECSRACRSSAVLKQIWKNGDTEGTGKTDCRNEGGKQSFVGGKTALIQFLEYHGYSDMVQRFLNSVGTLSKVRDMDLEEVERVSGVHGLFHKRRLMFALEQYKKCGHLPLRHSHLPKENNTGKKRHRNGASLRHLCGEQNAEHVHGQNMTVRLDVAHNRLKSVANAEKMILEGCWTVLKGTRMSPRFRRTSTMYEKNTHWCHRVVIRDQSLWHGAAKCQLSLESGCLEQRLRTSTQRNVVVNNSSPDQKEDCLTVAMKQVRLKALKEELRVHLATVEELQSMIDTLEKDIQNSSV